MTLIFFSDVFWYREGHEVEELEDSSDVELSSEGDKHSIVLYNVNKQLGGQYMCIAVNEKGKTIQYLVLTVKGIVFFCTLSAMLCRSIMF